MTLHLEQRLKKALPERSKGDPLLLWDTTCSRSPTETKHTHLTTPRQQSPHACRRLPRTIMRDRFDRRRMQTLMTWRWTGSIQCWPGQPELDIRLRVPASENLGSPVRRRNDRRSISPKSVMAYAASVELARPSRKVLRDRQRQRHGSVGARPILVYWMLPGLLKGMAAWSLNL